MTPNLTPSLEWIENLLGSVLKAIRDFTSIVNMLAFSAFCYIFGIQVVILKPDWSHFYTSMPMPLQSIRNKCFSSLF